MHIKTASTRKVVFTLLFLLCVCAAGFARQAGRFPATVVALCDTLPDFDTTFTKVEVESDFPGGERGWIKFLQANLVYPQRAIRKEVQGTVVLQFIVDTEGRVSNLEAISGPPLLRQAAIDAMKHTPKWTPAYQGGKAVKSYKKQPITFRLQAG